MNRHLTFFLAFLSFVLINPDLKAQQAHTIKMEENMSSPKATLEQLAWIAGHWKGEAFGGSTEEIWSSPVGSSMMGAFKLSMGDEIAFYELCVLREVDETVLLQLKHFHNDLKGWEEKDETVDFPLVKITEAKLTSTNLLLKK